MTVVAQPDFLAVFEFHPVQRFELLATIATIAGLAFWLWPFPDWKPGKYVVIVHVFEDVSFVAFVSFWILSDGEEKSSKVSLSCSVQDEFNFLFAF